MAVREQKMGEKLWLQITAVATLRIYENDVLLEQSS